MSTPSLPKVAQALLDPQSYPQPPQNIEMKQTQMSFVFLADDLVYKIKKPVDLGYLDYTTLEKRRRFCEKELVLNQRLSPEVYLSVEPITKEADRIVIGGRGEVVEYAVKMRKLPQDRMMDVLLPKNAVSEEMVASVADKLAEFHRRADTSAEIGRFGELATVTQNNDENFSQTEKYIGEIIPPDTHSGLKNYTTGFITRNAELILKRVAEGRIKDCHGDLHAAHVCFAEGTYIYDCIEFNDRFRYCDVASEVAFLAMDLDRYGRQDLSQAFVNAYVARSRDDELMKLLSFYKCYRACVRGKVACFTFESPHISADEKANSLEAAKGYFSLALSYA